MICCDVCEEKIIGVEVRRQEGGTVHLCDHHEKQLKDALLYTQSIFLAKSDFDVEVDVARFKPTPRTYRPSFPPVGTGDYNG